MPERKIKAPLPNGQIVDALEVDVHEATERWSDVTLEDGTVLRVKCTIVGAARFPGHWDAEGNPLYQIKSTPVVTISRTPDNLKKN